MNLSKNFTLAELTASETAAARHIKEQFALPPEVVANLTRLCTEVLQPFRDSWGKPVTITSGYRCLRLNKAVGGVSDSAHVTGKAADISFAGMSRADTLAMVEKLIEAGAKRIGLGWSFIHVDIDYGKPTPAVFLYGAKTPGWLSSKRAEFLDKIKSHG